MPKSIKLLAPLLLLFSLFPAISSAQPPQGDWMNRSAQFRTKFYSVRTDLPKEEAIALAEHMDLVFASYKEMFTGFGRWRPKQLTLWLFADRDDYKSTLLSKFGTSGEGSAGMCISRGDSVALVAWRVENIDDLKSTLQHEGFHQFARQLFPNLPLWANEGMAEVFGRGVVINGKVVLGEVSALDKQRLARSNSKSEFRRFREFMTMESKEWQNAVVQGKNASLNYLQAWSMSHFFLYADEAKHQKNFLRFLSMLNQNEPYEQAFIKAFGVPRFDQMEQSWAKYMNQQSGTDYRETIRRMEFLSKGMTKLRESDINPISMEELKSELQKINFEFLSDAFGEETSMSASNERLFTIPVTVGQETRPVFRLVDSRGKPVVIDEESTRPVRRPTTPLALETHGYLPREFRVKWKRVRREYQPNFEVK